MDNLNNTSISQIYIGYEEREHRAYEVCKYSLERRNPKDVKVIRLRSQDISEYERNWGEPQSTDFTFTRFWVPYLSGYKGYSIFVDCDFLFQAPIWELEKYVDPDCAVSLVKHPEYIPHSLVKMDKIVQHRSYRKNWASLMVFNNAHPDNQWLTPERLNNWRPGIDFHHINWTDKIGSLPLEWNCLDGYYHLTEPKAIHYTDGGPWFDDYQETMYSHLWKSEEMDMHNGK